ncbi:MAG: carbohydrate ABC transporter permease [Desulfurococcales archaeon]|nr:carbohydrate ABC transporter permease [Desulfurococcales archaeon]
MRGALSLASRLLGRRGGRLEEAPLTGRGFQAILVLALLAASLPIILSYTLLVELSFSSTLIMSPFQKTQFTLENWRLFLEGKLAPTAARIYSPAYIRSMIVNTLIVAAGVTVVVIAASAPAAYALSRLRFRFRAATLRFLILLHAFPGVALIIGVYAVYVYLYKRLFVGGLLPKEYLLLYSFAYVIVARASLEVPMSTWILKGFFDRVPWEVEWAALVDGASRLRTFWQVMLPLIKPGLAAVAIFAFMAGWEELIYVVVFLPREAPTLASFIHYQLSGGSLEASYLPVVAAAATVYLIPTILFFVFTQKLLLEAAHGGLKA